MRQDARREWEPDPNVDWVAMEAELNEERTILWRGRQWCVTEHGLETIASPYHYDIPRDALGRLHESPEGPYSAVIEQMAEKTWLDYSDFLTAFLEALEIHRGAYSPLPAGCLERSIAAERRIRMLGEP